MPKLFATDPSRLGYVCDEYDDPVHDVATNVCYRNFCEADAAGVRNWDYGCNELELPVLSPEDSMLPAYYVPPAGPPDESGTWIGDGGPPWRRRTRATGPSGGSPRGGGGGGRRAGAPSGGGTSPAPGTSPTPGAPSPDRRIVGGGLRPGRTIYTGADDTTPGRRMGGGGAVTGTVGRGRSRTDDGTMEAAPDMPTPAPGRRMGGGGAVTGTVGRGGVRLIGGEDGSTILATADGRIRSNQSGSGTGPALIGGADGAQQLATAGRTMTPMQSTTRASTTYRRQYHAQMQPSTQAARSSSMHVTAHPNASAAPMRRSTHSLPGRQSLAMRPSHIGGGARLSQTPMRRGMHGLGLDLSLATTGGAVLLLGGALIAASYFMQR